MADLIDKANELVERIPEEALAEHKLLNKPKFPYVKNEEPFECIECGEIIPALRRKVTQSELCIDCKNDLDYRLSKEGML